MVNLSDYRSVFFEYSKSFDSIPTTIRILSTPTDLCIFISQEEALRKKFDIKNFEDQKNKDIYLFSEDIHSFLRAKKLFGQKKLLVFCLARDIGEICKELETVLAGEQKISEFQPK